MEFGLGPRVLFFCATSQQSLDRPAFDLHTTFAFQLIGDGLATQLRSLVGKLVDPRYVFLRQLEPVPPTRFVVAQAGHATLLEAAQRLVERLARETERGCHSDDAHAVDHVRPQHLVLDLDLVERVEEALA